MGNIIFRMMAVGVWGVFALSCSAAPAEPVAEGCRAELEAAQGVSLQGLSSNGIQAQGFNIQGLSVQGFNIQGLSVQGFNIQGLSPQGFNIQGLSPQGFNIQGLTSQGLSPQGFSAQGFSAQGLSPQGISPQGISAQGFSAQGVSAQGISPQGISAQGLMSQGLTAQGLTAQGTALGGVALRGVSSGDAARWATGELSTLPRSQIVFISLERGVLSGLTADGKHLRGVDLKGLLLPFSTNEGKTLWIGIIAVAPHPDVPDLPLYSLELEGQSLCEAGAGGLFVPGVWDETGAVHASIDSGGRHIDSTFSCLAGVIAKCTVWGYRPWTVGAQLHETCTRMARADYCGNGVPHTENGTTIDMFDTQGIQTEVANDGLRFEAGWGEDGAVCVREPRYLDRDPSGQVLLPSCWADKPQCADFSEALGYGADIGNNSPHKVRLQFASPHCL